MDDAQQSLHAEMAVQHWWFRGRRRILRTLVESILPPDPNRLVVDVGCGPGANLAALADAYATAGVDPSPKAISLAKARIPSGRFFEGELTEAPADFDAGASLYLLMDVLEHVSDDHLLLSTVFSRSKPGTHVLVTVPAHWPLWSSHDETLGHYRRYDQARMESMWLGLPVSVRLVSYFNSRLYPPIRAVRWVASGLGRSAGRRGTDLWLPPNSINAFLEDLFAGESERLEKCLSGDRTSGYKHGASLIAILRLDEAGVEPRAKPDHLPPDRKPRFRRQTDQNLSDDQSHDQNSKGAVV